MLRLLLCTLLVLLTGQTPIPECPAGCCGVEIAISSATPGVIEEYISDLETIEVRLPIERIEPIPLASTALITLTWGRETLSDLSDQFELPLESLVAANHLPLRWGQVLTLPGGIRPTFSWPLANPSQTRITQGFNQTHQALDLAGPLSDPVVASAAGVVRFAGWYDEAYGNLVVLDHNDGYSSWYAHLERVEVAAGEWVPIGDRLGLIGASGQVTGPHLHFEIRYHNRCQVPTRFLDMEVIQ